MISVTAAAHSFRSSRSLGLHLRAYGSGRVALNSENLEESKRKPNNLLTKLISKLWHCFLKFLRTFCPFVNYLINEKSKIRIRKNGAKGDSVFDKVEDDLVLKIFMYFDGRSVIKMGETCSRFKEIVRQNSDDLAKIQKDQIKLYFDEGEVIVSPVDERRVPSRYQMVPIQNLSNYLRHLSTLSLFIRGLIPVETIPLLSCLSKHKLNISQIYLLWCEFDDEADEYLRELFQTNSESLSDIGLESCSPPHLISDALLQNNLNNLISLRIWHDNFDHQFPITDKTLFKLAELFKSGESTLETLDLNCCKVTVTGVTALIEAWYTQEGPLSHFCLSLRNCAFQRYDLQECCRILEIPLDSNGYLQKKAVNLTVNVN